LGVACCLIFAGYLFGLLFNPEDGGSMFFQNISELLLGYMVLQSRR
jgi:hypothetical protein